MKKRKASTNTATHRLTKIKPATAALLIISSVLMTLSLLRCPIRVNALHCPSDLSLLRSTLMEE